MRQTTVVFWVLAIGLTVLMMKTHISSCADRDAVTCAVSFALSQQIVALVIVLAYAIALFFSRGTIVGSILTIPVGTVGAGLAISGGWAVLRHLTRWCVCCSILYAVPAELSEPIFLCW